MLEAAGTVLTRLDGRSISAEATLSVRSYGAAVRPFHACDCRRERSFSPGQRQRLRRNARRGRAQSAKRRNQRLVKVQLPKKTTGPVEVRLACRRDYDPLKDQSWCELAGFEVVGAARQWGVTAVAAGERLAGALGHQQRRPQTDQLPESLRKADVVAGFEYSTQPYSLTARLAPRKTRISVDPKYVLLVDRDAVRLEGKLIYTVRGAKIADAWTWRCPGWELDEVGPDNLVVVDAVTLNGGEVDIPVGAAVLGHAGTAIAGPSRHRGGGQVAQRGLAAAARRRRSGRRRWPSWRPTTWN